MKLSQIATILEANIHCGEDKLDIEANSACGCDMMSEALAFVKDQTVLLTGLVNPQVIRTAEMIDINCIVFVRGKEPTEPMIELAKIRGLVLMSTRYLLFSACGMLYTEGLRGGEKA